MDKNVINYTEIQLKAKEPDDERYDEVAKDRIRMLKKQMEISIKREDFDESKEIKNKIVMIHGLAEKIYSLECNKKVSVINQDYDSAKQIKQDIEKLKQLILGIGQDINKDYSFNEENKIMDFDESKIIKEKQRQDGLDL